MAGNAPRTIAAPNDFEDVHPSQVLDDWEDIPQPAPAAGPAVPAAPPPPVNAENLIGAARALAVSAGRSLPIIGPGLEKIGETADIGAHGMLQDLQHALGLRSDAEMQSDPQIVASVRAKNAKDFNELSTKYPAADFAGKVAGPALATSFVPMAAAPAGVGAAGKVGAGMINAGMIGELFRQDARARGADEPTAEAAGNQAAAFGLLTPALAAAGPVAARVAPSIVPIAGKVGEAAGKITGGAAGAQIAHALGDGGSTLAEFMGMGSGQQFGGAIGRKMAEGLAAPIAGAVKAIGGSKLPQAASAWLGQNLNPGVVGHAAFPPQRP